MDDKIPEPLSRPVEPMTPTTPNIPPASVGTTGASTPLGKPASNIGHPGRGKRVFKTLIFLIVLGAAGYFGYMWYQGRTMAAELSQAQSDKAAAEQKATDAEAKVKELEAKATATPAPKSDDELIKEWAGNQCALKGKEVGTVTVKLVKGEFAQLSYICKGDNEGPEVYLKKANSSWYLVYQGLGPIPADTRALYKIPAEFPKTSAN
jgi:hypothetical protein